MKILLIREKVYIMNPPTRKTIHTTLQTQGYILYKNNSDRLDKQHTHSYYEMILLLKGKIDYFADGVIYPLAPKDIIATQAGTPHGKLKLYDNEREYIVMFFDKKFFETHDCPQYEAFFHPATRFNRKISASVCESSGLFDVYQRLQKYTNDFTDIHNAVTQALLVEFLHILNTGVRFSKTYISNPQVEKTLDYIDQNLTQKLGLEEIAQHAYLSKYHLCRLFKEYVGYTVNQYITLKRIEKTQTLIKEKKNITEACVEAGFSDYSAFYKAFVKLHGAPPKTTMKSK